MVGKVKGKGTVDFFEGEELEILADGFGRLAAVEGVDEGVQGNAGGGDVVDALALLDLLLGHAAFILHFVGELVGFRKLTAWLPLSSGVRVQRSIRQTTVDGQGTI